MTAAAIVLLLVVLCCISSVLIVLSNNAINVAVNRVLWNAAEPPVYYIEMIINVQGDRSHLAAIVENGRVIRNVHEDAWPLSESQDILEDVSVEGIFNALDQLCVPQRLDCIISFDSQFHYPSTVSVFDWLGIVVTQFHTCQSVSNCVS